jgi:hypothetical protein
MRPVEILSTLLSSLEVSQEPTVDELMSDGTGMASFIIFRSSKLPNLEVGRSYRVHGVFVENPQGRPSMRFTSRSEIESILDIDLTATEDVKERIPLERTLPSGQATLFAFGT